MPRRGQEQRNEIFSSFEFTDMTITNLNLAGLETVEQYFWVLEITGIQITRFQTPDIFDSKLFLFCNASISLTDLLTRKTKKH